jgi:fumarate reductase subunit D
MDWKDFGTITLGIVDIIKSSVVPLMITLATVYFLWGVLSYIMAAGDEKKLTEARYYILYGLIGLFVIVAMWGLVSIITNTFINSGGGMPKGPI